MKALFLPHKNWYQRLNSTMLLIQKNVLNAFLLILMVFLATACFAQSETQDEATSEQSSDTSPRQVVATLVDAMQANDAERIRDVFASDATQVYGSGAKKSGDQFFAWLESDIISPHGRVDDAELSVDGNTVVITGVYQNNNGYQSQADFHMTVENGKITAWAVR